MFIFGYNAISAILRGLGDSKRPVLFIGIACVTNIVLDVLLVGGLGWGAAGAAVATVFSQGVSLVLVVILLLRRKDFVFDFIRESIRIHVDKFRSILRLGLPVSLQETILSFSFWPLRPLSIPWGISPRQLPGSAANSTLLPCCRLRPFPVR